MIIERDVPVPCDDGLLLRAAVFAGRTTIHAGPEHPSHLLLPIISRS